MQRAAGAVIGSAVGNALGGPFEFGPQGAFSAQFPAPGAGGKMCGGSGWDPGEATDDTQMVVLVAESLLEQDGLDLPDIFARFQRWAAAEPKDIGLQTEDVLTNGMPWDLAAAIHFQVNQRAAGKGALMRASTSAVHFAAARQEATMDAARRIAALTHGNRAAWEGTAIFHELEAGRHVPPDRVGAAQPPAPRVVTRWILSRPETLTEIEQLRLKTVLANCPELDALTGHVRSFAQMLTEHQDEQLP